ncbi:MAG: cytochrome c biogenesis heme-transporting ATPase CcmA [Aquabacterium sp.]|nr:cytochrome c biogenesis heme-transporting ATPase CcmA [Aquabacterium sp.]
MHPPAFLDKPAPPAKTAPTAPLAGPPAAACVLACTGLAGDRGDRRLFEGLDLALPAGTVTWLRGRNGRGKTTLLRLLAGLSTPAAGSMAVQGQPQRAAGPQGRRLWVYIGHQNALKDDLTATEALRFLARLHGLPHDDASLQAALQRMGIAQRRHAVVRTLSQGQRRRVALARLALSGGAPLWLLDEPFDALDADGIDALNAVIGGHALAGGCVLLTSHQALSIRQPVPAVLDLEAFAPASRQASRRSTAHEAGDAAGR